MKRTFGRFMSLLLVLAMVLAMVPAALAANQAYSVEPDSTIKIKTSIIKEGSVSWSSSDTSVAKVEGSTTEATVTGVKASNTAVRITATGKVNGRDYSEYFTVYVRDAYTLTLALSNSNINGTVALNQNDTRTLTATVTVGSSGGVTAGNLANCEVHFTSDSDAISVSPDSAKVTASTVGNYTTYKVETTVKAEKVGGATLTAQVYYKSDKGMKPSTSATATKTIGFRVSGAATVTVTLPDAQKTLSLEAMGTSGTLQPKVSGYSGTAQPKLLYLYDSEDNSLYVRPNTATTSATVEPYKACDATNIYICIASYNAGKTYKDAKEGKLVGSYAVCTVSIKNKGMSVTALEVMNSESVTYNGKTSRLQTLLDNGTMVFGLQDSYYKPAVVSPMIRGTLEVTARIKAPDSLLNSETDRRNAYSRIEWTSSAPAVAKVKTTSSDDQKAVATIEAVAPGTATITAKVDGNVTATYSVTVYQGRAYLIKEETSTEDTTTSTADGAVVKVNGKKYVVTSDFSEEIIPEGFKKGELTFEGSKYSVITQEASGINAMYLTEKDSDDADFYMYNSDDGSFAPFEEVEIAKDRYIIPLMNDGKVNLPSQYQKTTLTLNGKEFDTWQDTKDAEYYIIYALNSDGEKTTYRYDTTDGTYQKYTPESTGSSSSESKLSNGKGIWGKILNFVENFLDIVVIIAIALILLLVLVLIVTAVKLRHRDLELDDLYDEYGIDLDEEEEALKAKKKEEKQEKKAQKASKQVSKKASKRYDDEDEFEGYDEDDLWVTENIAKAMEKPKKQKSVKHATAKKAAAKGVRSLDETGPAIRKPVKNINLQDTDDFEKFTPLDEEEFDNFEGYYSDDDYDMFGSNDYDYDDDELFDATADLLSNHPEKKRSHAEMDDTFKMDVIDLD